ncbi:MAG: hypothetical protein K2F67_08520, partial [Eubacterium sp.]|nr:hypothetical protein [Eubacterium sp.]
HYKRTFSQIRPSDETIERIFEMNKTKSKRIRFKGLFVAAACLAALLCGTLTANAATDGALFEGINLIVNGENVNLKDYIKNYNSYVDENGNDVSEYEFELPEDNGEASIVISEDIGDITASYDTDSNMITYEINE